MITYLIKSNNLEGYTLKATRKFSTTLIKFSEDEYIRSPSNPEANSPSVDSASSTGQMEDHERFHPMYKENLYGLRPNEVPTEWLAVYDSHLTGLLQGKEEDSEERHKIEERLAEFQAEKERRPPVSDPSFSESSSDEESTGSPSAYGEELKDFFTKKSEHLESKAEILSEEKEDSASQEQVDSTVDAAEETTEKSGTSNIASKKRKFQEEESESNAQGSTSRFKQDSSEITSDGEMPDFMDTE